LWSNLSRIGAKSSSAWRVFFGDGSAPATLNQADRDVEVFVEVSTEEIGCCRKVADCFWGADNPGAGTVGLRGVGDGFFDG